MKLLENLIIPNNSGTVKMIPEEADDLWLAYNLISAGDVVTTLTTRKSHQITLSGKITTPTRVTVELEIAVTALDYDKASSVLRIRGKNRVHTQHVTAGSFHTIELEKNKEFTLGKKVWDPQAMEKLEEGLSAKSAYDLGVVLICEGMANLYLIGKGGFTKKQCAKVEQRINPKTGLNPFFERVFRDFTKHVDLDAVRCAVIGSPSSIKDEFRSYLICQAHKSKIKSLENNRSKIIPITTRKNCLNEVLSDPKVMSFMNDTKGDGIEIRAMKELNDRLFSGKDSDRACYGLKSVNNANELGAIETLMITDELFRSPEVGLRKTYSGLVKSVKESGGKAMVISSTNECAEELAKLTGIAAVLRFPVPDIDELQL